MEKEWTSQAGALERLRPAAMEPLVLASGSPRRRDILHAVDWPYDVCSVDVDESLDDGEAAADYVRRLARAKAEAGAASRLFGLVLGADTVVVVEGEILGKPRDDEDARRMLRTLSGRWHEVLTGVALVRAESGRTLVGVETTRVRFAEMSDEEITWHVATGEPLDKAGAYALQGRAALFIEGIEGDYWNVIGLPVRLLYELVRRFESQAS